MLSIVQSTMQELHRDMYQEYINDQLHQLRSQYPHCNIKSQWLQANQMDSFDTEVEAYQLLQDSDLTPVLLDHGYLATVNLRTNTWHYSYIVTTNCGISVAQKYIHRDVRHWYLGPGVSVQETTYSQSSKLEDLIEVPYTVPVAIVTQIENIIHCLVLDYGIYLQDIHLGNFVLDNKAIVRVSDLSNIRAK